MGMGYMQPIIRGIEAVGSVRVRYKYNGGNLILPPSLMRLNGMATKEANTIECKDFIDVAGFRLDSNFLTANPQIASSFMIPILGGGAVALTNNNRSGTLTVNCTRVSTPTPANGTEGSDNNGNPVYKPDEKTADSIGSMYKPDGAAIGPISDTPVYDLAFIAQVQQSQLGGDSYGATIDICFDFAGLTTVMEFQGVTVATVNPLGLAGNDAVDYGVVLNYLNWTANYSDSSGNMQAVL